MKKSSSVFLALSAALLVMGGAGCASATDDQPAVAPAPQQIEKQAPAPAAVAPVATSTEAVPAAAVDKTVKEFSITGKNWEWDPNTITVKKGDKVHLKLTGMDETHGFAIREYGINVNMPEGTTQTVDFVADKAGTFEFRCSVPCGSGHREMVGKLIVQ